MKQIRDPARQSSVTAMAEAMIYIVMGLSSSGMLMIVGFCLSALLHAS